MESAKKYQIHLQVSIYHSIFAIPKQKAISEYGDCPIV